MWLYLTSALLICLLGAPARVSAATESSGYIALCIERFPDGMAIFDDVNGDPSERVLSIFKGDQVWTIPLDNFIGLLLNDTADKEIFNSTNGQNVATIFPLAPPTSDKRMVSFFGFNRYDPFFNNLLIFHNPRLLRYRVNPVGQNALSASLISTHSTLFWVYNKTLDQDNIALETLKGSKTLVVHVSGFPYGDPIYVMNAENLDFPITLNSRRKGPVPHSSELQSTYKVPFRGSDAASYYLSFLTTGSVCYDSKCVPLDKFIDCAQMVAIYVQGFTYWLQYDTNLNIRLLAIALISIMVVNAVMALVFIIDQINKLSMLS